MTLASRTDTAPWINLNKMGAFWDVKCLGVVRIHFPHLGFVQNQFKAQLSIFPLLINGVADLECYSLSLSPNWLVRPMKFRLPNIW